MKIFFTAIFLLATEAQSVYGLLTTPNTRTKAVSPLFSSFYRKSFNYNNYDSRYDHESDYMGAPPLNQDDEFSTYLDRPRRSSFDEWRETSRSSVQGGSRRNWSNNPGSRRSDVSQVYMDTESGVLDADFEVWEGPDDTPTRMHVYSEDGSKRPFHAVVKNPNNGYNSQSMSVKNNAGMEFPMSAGVSSVRNSYGGSGGGYVDRSRMKTIQGQALKTWSFDESVESVEVNIVTDGRPMKVIVELWGAGGHVKQVAEVYNDDGNSRPFATIVNTPGGSNTICVRNIGPAEFPISASCEVRSYDDYDDYDNFRNRNDRRTSYVRHGYENDDSFDSFVNSPYGNRDKWLYRY